MNIEALRKRELRISFSFQGDGCQDPHSGDIRFPFGQAVQSSKIAASHEAGTDDEFCSHISNNYNWIVDTYRRAIFERRSNYCLMSRMKWKPLKPTQGQFSTAITDAMIQCGATVCSRPSRGTTLGGCGGSSAVYRHLDQTLGTAGQ